MEINLVEFRSADKEYVWLRYVDSMQSYIQKIWGWDKAWQESNFLKSLDTYQTFVLEFDTKRIGYVQYLHNSDFSYLSMIVLDKEFQSKGYGAFILDKIQSLKPELPLKLRCFKVNQKAYQFYLKNNFKLISSDNEFHTLQRP